DASDIWRSIDPIALSAVCAFFQSINMGNKKLGSYIYSEILKFKENNINLDDVTASSEFYHSYPLAIYLASRLNFDSNQSNILIHN
ncbi:hypothetical protein ACI3PL_25860, partial [Lacticaseibacillus paracasei]